MKPEHLWKRFVFLALLSGLLPGFALATAMTATWLIGVPSPLWYPAAVQSHATAFLIGWGGAMILGVALHFLPRLRGVKLLCPEWVNRCFWCLVLGLVLRITGQLTLATLNSNDSSFLLPWLNGAVIAGLILILAGVCGLLLILIATFRTGRPLAENKGFRQAAPLLCLSALALAVAQIAWCIGGISALRAGLNLTVLPLASHALALDLMLFDFMAAIAIAMSARLFPLTFWILLPWTRGLSIASISLALGLILTILSTLFPSPEFLIGSAGFQATGILLGAWAVRIFHPRKIVTRTQTRHRLWAGPADVGVVSAWFWAVIAAVALILSALHYSGMSVPSELTQKNIPRHAMGAGFMTLLIVSVGWKMLPGFGRGRPRGEKCMWGAVGMGNLAVTLRILPMLWPGVSWGSWNWSAFLLPLAGLAGFSCLLLFSIALWLSLRIIGESSVSHEA